MPKPWMCAVAVLGLSACEKLPPDQAHFQKAQNAYKNSDYATALQEARPIALQGHPAGLMLLAKMYAYGEGVPYNGEKAELLRNLAAIKLANSGLESIDSSKKAPVMEILNQALKGTELGSNNLPGTPDSTTSITPETLQVLSADLQRQVSDVLGPDMFEQPLNSPGVPPVVGSMNSATGPSASESPIPLEKTTPPQLDISKRTSRSESQSLGALRQSAEKGDALAMQLLSSGYRHGFYGLPRNGQQAAYWAEKAKQSGVRLDDERDADSLEQMPWKRFGAIAGLGLGLMVFGLWRAWRSWKTRHVR